MSKRKNQRGFVLITALTISILYFALMELLLIDSSRALGEAQRFRAHVVAGTLAESAAELAAFQIITRNNATIDKKDFQGTMHGVLQRNSNSFVLQGEGLAIGAMKQSAKVRVEGRVEGLALKIDFTVHGE
jgi:Tfp pilus assembly protein PilX